ncbi:MAG: energy transducer TonB, partial [Deltaproteobacteria bacterium]|nr:energy transducer TonB [Deltaproteobacteria bacterium]
TVLCLSEGGWPTKIYFSQPSGLRHWDQRIFETMRGWRYEPYKDADGKPIAACTTVTFVYKP